MYCKSSTYLIIPPCLTRCTRGDASSFSVKTMHTSVFAKKCKRKVAEQECDLVTVLVYITFLLKNDQIFDTLYYITNDNPKHESTLKFSHNTGVSKVNVSNEFCRLS